MNADWYTRALPPIAFRETGLAILKEAEGRKRRDPGFKLSFETVAILFSEVVIHPSRTSLGLSDSTPATMRFAALMELLDQPALREFVHRSDDGVPEIHVAALEAAATCPFRPEGGFDPQAFLTLLRPIAQNVDAVDDLLGR